MKSPKSAFTLLELLVVIAIIAMLAGILFPVFGRAREMARRSSCSSNLKQIGMGLIQYSQDYDEVLIADWHGDSIAIGTGPTQAPGNATTSYKWTDAVFPYMKNTQVFLCPSATERAAKPCIFYKNLPAGQTAGQATDQYGYGSYVITHGYGPNQPTQTPPISHPLVGDLVTLARVESPTTTVWVADGDGDFSSEATATAFNDVVARHFGGLNALYVDGHVKFAKTAQIYTRNAANTFFNSATIQDD